MGNNLKNDLSSLDLKNLRTLIKSRRKQLGLTQSEVANLAGLCTQHYSRIERGEYIPSLPTFFKLAEVLNIDLGGLNFKEERISSTMYEIMSLLGSFNKTQQQAVLSFLKTMQTPAGVNV